MPQPLPPGVEIHRGPAPGPRVGIMGAGHGDEPAGLAALDFLRGIFQKKLPERGEVVLIHGNPAATAAGTRFIDRDLNRSFAAEGLPDGDGVEGARARELTPVLRGLDVLVDLHSTSVPSPSWGLTTRLTPECHELAKHLPLDHFIEIPEDGPIRGTSLDPVHAAGGIAIAAECGDHVHDGAPDTAIAVAKSVLTQTGVMTFANNFLPPEILRVVEILMVEDPGTFEMAREFRGFENLKPSEPIARDAGKIYRAPEAGAILVMPGTTAGIRAGRYREIGMLATPVR